MALLRRRRSASVTGVAVLVKIVFVAVTFALASITALQEPRGLSTWERRWRNQHKKAAAKVGRGGCAAIYHRTGGKVAPIACEKRDGSYACLRPQWLLLFF